VEAHSPTSASAVMTDLNMMKHLVSESLTSQW
jgi:hypothetical protein